MVRAGQEMVHAGLSALTQLKNQKGKDGAKGYLGECFDVGPPKECGWSARPFVGSEHIYTYTNSRSLFHTLFRAAFHSSPGQV